MGGSVGRHAGKCGETCGSARPDGTGQAPLERGLAYLSKLTGAFVACIV
jgi:hypothetical protein